MRGGVCKRKIDLRARDYSPVEGAYPVWSRLHDARGKGGVMRASASDDKLPRIPALSQGTITLKQDGFCCKRNVEPCEAFKVTIPFAM